MKAQAIRERIERLMAEERIPFTDEQVAAVIRVAMCPKWPDAERWETAVIERAALAVRLRRTTSPQAKSDE